MGGFQRETGEYLYVAPFFKSLNGRYKRIRLRPKGKPDTDCYHHQVALPADLEQLSEEGHIDLYYGDESHVCSQGYVPYGWQFPDEEVYIPSEKAYRINCPGFINRKSEYMGTMTENNINAEFVMEYPEKFSFTIQKETVIVLDNAGVHKAKIIRERIPFWQNRGLFIAFLPPYSPHLNIAETVWRKLKKEWLNPEDYLNKDTLCYAANRCLATLGHEFKINFSHFNINLF